MVTVHESPLAAGLNQTPFGYQPILVTTNPLHPTAQCCCLTFLRGHETQFLVATYVLLNQEIEWNAEPNVVFFLLYRGRPKKDYKPLSCMSHISHSIPFSGIPITLFIWKYTNNTSGEHCNLYCHWSGLEGYAVGPWTKHITYIKYSTLLIIFSCIIVCVYIYIYIYL